MPLGQSIRNAIGTVWRSVLSATERGKSTYDVVQDTLSTFQQLNLPTGMIDTSAVDQLHGMATSWVNSRDTLTAAADTDPITSDMVTLAPWSMDLNSFNTQPAYHVILGINVEGQEEIQYRTVTGVTQLPDTVGDLRSASLINAYAMSVGTNPGGGVGGTVTGIENITITVGPALG